MDLHLHNKTVVITGGTTGIGRSVAFEFLEEGANVATFARRQEKVDAFLSEASARYPKDHIFAETADVSREEDVAIFAEHVREHFGSIDVWINNAGVKIDKFFENFTSDEWDYVMNVNVKGVWIGCKTALTCMKPQRSGVIINISSFASKIPHAGQSLYAAAKSAVSSLTKSIAGEVAPFGIRVVGIVPGMIQTDLASDIEQFYEKYVNDIALHRLGQPDDLAKPIVFLASDAAGYISGVDVEISGGKFCIQNTPYSWQARNEQSTN